MTLFQKIKSEAKALSEKEKQRLIDYRMEEEDGISEADAEKLWVEEIKKRDRLARAGKMKFLPIEKSLAQLQRKLA